MAALQRLSHTWKQFSNNDRHPGEGRDQAFIRNFSELPRR